MCIYICVWRWTSQTVKTTRCSYRRCTGRQHIITWPGLLKVWSSLKQTGTHFDTHRMPKHNQQTHNAADILGKRLTGTIELWDERCWSLWEASKCHASEQQTDSKIFKINMRIKASDLWSCWMVKWRNKWTEILLH